LLSSVPTRRGDANGLSTPFSAPAVVVLKAEESRRGLTKYRGRRISANCAAPSLCRRRLIAGVRMPSCRCACCSSRVAPRRPSALSTRTRYNEHQSDECDENGDPNEHDCDEDVRVHREPPRRGMRGTL